MEKGKLLLQAEQKKQSEGEEEHVKLLEKSAGDRRTANAKFVVFLVLTFLLSIVVLTLLIYGCYLQRKSLTFGDSLRF